METTTKEPLHAIYPGNEVALEPPHNAIYTDGQRRYFSLLSHTGYSRLSVVFVFL